MISENILNKSAKDGSSFLLFINFHSKLGSIIIPTGYLMNEKESEVHSRQFYYDDSMVNSVFSNMFLIYPV